MTGRGVIVSFFVFVASTFGALQAEGENKQTSPKKSPPAWVKSVNLLKAGKLPSLKPCRLRYRLSWNNLIDAGEASIVMRDGGRSEKAGVDVLLGEASARSSGLARLFWSYDCELKSQVDKNTLRALWFEHSETENGDTVSYRTDFKKQRVETLRYDTDAASGKVVPKKRTFKYGKVYDLLSVILTLRSLPLKNGETLVAVVQPFDSPYLVSFEIQGREKRKYLGKEEDTIRLGVKIQKINKDLTLKKYKKLKTATLWVSEDEFRLPLELRAEIFVGYVAATLLEREFLPQNKSEEKGQE